MLSQHYILKQSSAVFTKWNKVLTNTKKSILRLFSIKWEKTSSENPATTSSIVLRYQKLSETQKEPLTKYFLETKRFCHFVKVTSPQVHQNSCSRQMGRARNTRDFQTNEKGPLINYLVLWYRETIIFQHFFADRPMFHQKILNQTKGVPENLRKWETPEFSGSTRSAPYNLFGTPIIWNRKFSTFLLITSYGLPKLLNVSAASLLPCSQLVLFSVQEYSKSQTADSVVQFFLFLHVANVTQTSCCRFVRLL